jgi:catechol 2,3-dioxygenase-like lactoylglutathione lyase family enzyme
MIHGLHHVSVVTHDLAAAIRDYELVLDRKSTWRVERDSIAQAWFDLPNLSLVLDASQTVAKAQEGIHALAFAVDDVAKAHRLLTQRAVDNEEPRPQEFGAEITPATWLSKSATHGLRMGLVQSALRQTSMSKEIGLDHIVVSTPDPERAIVLYGARLGLDLRLDRSNPDWDARLLFFRCGDLIVEIAHRLSGGRGEGPDRFMGFSWRAKNPDETHRRLGEAGFNVSEIRKGRRPGTRVFTVRNRTCGVPTIFVGPEAR